MEGDAGKVICREAERLKPAAVVMGTRGRSLMQRFPSLPFFYHSMCAFCRCVTSWFCFSSVLQGSVGEYCLHNCKVAPIIIVPGKGTMSGLINTSSQ